MRRAALLLLLVAVWYYCADLAQMVGGDTRRTQYLANGIFGAVVCLLWRDESKDSTMRGLALGSAYLWVLMPVCGVMWIPTATGTASVCNDVFAVPMSEFIGCGLAVAAGSFYDRLEANRG